MGFLKGLSELTHEIFFKYYLAHKHDMTDKLSEICIQYYYSSINISFYLLLCNKALQYLVT